MGFAPPDTESNDEEEEEYEDVVGATHWMELQYDDTPYEVILFDEFTRPVRFVRKARIGF